VAVENGPPPPQATNAAQAAARVAERFAQAPRYFELPAMRFSPAGSSAAAIAQAALRAHNAAQAGSQIPIQRVSPQPAAPVKAPRDLQPAANHLPAAIPESVPPISPQANAGEDAVAQFPAPGFADRVEEPATDSRVAPISSMDTLDSAAPAIVQSIEFRPAVETLVPVSESLGIADRVLNAASETLATLRREIELEEMEEALRPVEPAQPIHANLIAFPRELVATRKVRPRLIEGPLAAGDDGEGQLSIFEVEPDTISTEPAPAVRLTVEMLPDWSAIHLDNLPADEFASETAAPTAALPLYPAPFALRLISAAIDGTMVLASFLIGLALAASAIKPLAHGPWAVVGAAALLFAVGIAYQAIFFTLSDATPGMKYAGISLCTFDEQVPTRTQLRRRLGALLVSLLPVGLGLIWVLFDENHLSWHDRLSRTYQRQN